MKPAVRRPAGDLPPKTAPEESRVGGSGGGDCADGDRAPGLGATAGRQ